MLVDIMTNNTQYTTNCTNLHPTPTSDPLAKVELAFCTSSFRDLITELQVYAQYSIKMR